MPNRLHRHQPAAHVPGNLPRYAEPELEQAGVAHLVPVLRHNHGQGRHRRSSGSLEHPQARSCPMSGPCASRLAGFSQNGRERMVVQSPRRLDRG